MVKRQQRPARWRRRLARYWSGFRYRLGEVQWADAFRPLERLRPSLRTTTERNIWYLYVEQFWAGIFMAVVAFNATFALRLGASDQLVGWLSSIPALLAILVLVPAARFLESKKQRAPWLYGSLLIGRAAFFGAALVPWLVPGQAATALVAVLILRTIPMHFFSAGFSPMLADIIPERDRALVVANRAIITSATVAVFTYLFGLWMDAAADIRWARFPVNYQVVYGVGAIAGILSTYFVSRIHPPPARVIRRAGRPLWKAPPRLKGVVASAREMVRDNRAFVQIIINTVVFDFGAWMVGPLYMILFINRLNASDSWVGLNTTLAHIGVISGNVLWRRLLDRFGPNRTLRLAAPMAASYAFLVALFPDLTLILLWGMLINLVNPGVSLSHVSILYALCPVERRASYMAIYSTVANVGAFVAPMVGVALTHIMDIRWVLVVGGLIRLAGAGLFQVYRVEAPEVAET